MEIKVVDEKGQVKTPKEVNTTQPAGIDSPLDSEKLAIADVMGLERKELGKYTDKIDTLLRYVKSQEPDASPDRIKWMIRDLDMRLGTGPLAQKRINYVSRVAYLKLEQSKIEAEIQSHHI